MSGISVTHNQYTTPSKKFCQQGLLRMWRKYFFLHYTMLYILHHPKNFSTNILKKQTWGHIPPEILRV
jgi:hypothetical protein